MADSEIELDAEIDDEPKKKKKVLQKYYPGLIVLKDDGMMIQMMVQLEPQLGQRAAVPSCGLSSRHYSLVLGLAFGA